MGLEYVLYRSWDMFLKKSGLIKLKFRTRSKKTKFPSREEWKKMNIPFILQSKTDTKVPVHQNDKLKQAGEKILNGEIEFFNASWLNIGKDYDWLTNPITDYRYNPNQHWASIHELDPSAGDIKYVWEKSRFSYLLVVMRYDYHFDIDCGAFAINEILSWIDHNPVNRGPNWISSQEIGLRLMNWFFLLNYYQDHPALTQVRFATIMQSIYDQVLHIEHHIYFSRKTVRNNHAVTEVLLLYLAGHLFPFHKESKRWKRKGKKWFEKEISYQVYPDGSYLQHSMNYHRVVIQLLTLGIAFSEKIDDRLDEIVYTRAGASLNFLFQLHNEENGALSNYGNNDGSLFFPLGNADYSDFRSQLNALHFILNKTQLYIDSDLQEEAYWFGAPETKSHSPLEFVSVNQFDYGGYYSIRDKDTLTFLRCGNHRDRPGQADNLHLDLWKGSVNLLQDAGTYLYNSEPDNIQFFMGTRSHNTVMLDGQDQMLKSGRFIWLRWSQADYAKIVEDENEFVFDGQIQAYKNFNGKIRHKRVVRKKKGMDSWEVEDTLLNKPEGLRMSQVWHPHPKWIDRLSFEIINSGESKIKREEQAGWYSSSYGVREEIPEIHFSTIGNSIKTIIKVL